MHESREDPALVGIGAPIEDGAAERQQPVRRPSAAAFSAADPATWGKVSRNAPCPCGSGKKYKQCHGKLA
jgi:preprotein translocase subunit SecA